jgi:hypothetical protein
MGLRGEAFAVKAANKIALQKTHYAVLRERFGLSSRGRAIVAAEQDAALVGSQRALTLCRGLGDALGIARPQALVGSAMDIVRRPAGEVEPLLQGALGGARALGNLHLAGMVLRLLGYFRSRTGDHSEARTISGAARSRRTGIKSVCPVIGLLQWLGWCRIFQHCDGATAPLDNDGIH